MRGKDYGIITVADDMTCNSKIVNHSLNLAVDLHDRSSEITFFEAEVSAKVVILRLS